MHFAVYGAHLLIKVIFHYITSIYVKDRSDVNSANYYFYFNCLTLHLNFNLAVNIGIGLVSAFPFLLCCMHGRITVVVGMCPLPNYFRQMTFLSRAVDFRFFLP